MAGGPGRGAGGQASGQPELGAYSASLQRFWERAEHSEWMAWAQRRGEAARIAEAAGGRARAELERLDAWARALPGDVLQRWAMLDELCITKEQFLQVMEWKARRQGEAPVELPWTFESLDKADVRAADPCTEPGPATSRLSLYPVTRVAARSHPGCSRCIEHVPSGALLTHVSPPPHHRPHDR